MFWSVTNTLGCAQYLRGCQRGRRPQRTFLHAHAAHHHLGQLVVLAPLDDKGQLHLEALRLALERVEAAARHRVPLGDVDVLLDPPAARGSDPRRAGRPAPTGTRLCFGSRCTVPDSVMSTGLALYDLSMFRAMPSFISDQLSTRPISLNRFFMAPAAALGRPPRAAAHGGLTAGVPVRSARLGAPAVEQPDGGRRGAQVGEVRRRLGRQPEADVHVPHRAVRLVQRLRQRDAHGKDGRHHLGARRRHRRLGQLSQGGERLERPLKRLEKIGRQQRQQRGAAASHVSPPPPPAPRPLRTRTSP